MKCPACNVEVDQNAVYCHHCGERLDMAGSEPPQQEAGDPSPEPPPAEEPASMAERLKASVQSRMNSADDAERELWAGRYSSKAMIGVWLLCGAISLVLMALGIWFSARGWMPGGVRWGLVFVLLLITWGYPLSLLFYRRVSIRYRLTTQRFFHEAGILRHVTDRVEVIDMDDITFEQSILQRMFRVGTIHITSSDRTHPDLRIEGIENVKHVASMMDDARRAERLRRGVHIEAV